MPTELPIACSLSAEDQARRQLEMASLRDRLLEVRTSGAHGAVLRFERDQETRRRLAAIVAAERECCPFLQLSLNDEGPNTVLMIGGPDEAEPVIREIAGAFSGALSRD